MTAQTLMDTGPAGAGPKSLAARDRWIIVDLSGLEFIDAAGVSITPPLRLRLNACA